MASCNVAATVFGRDEEPGELIFCNRTWTVGEQLEECDVGYVRKYRQPLTTFSRDVYQRGTSLLLADGNR